MRRDSLYGTFIAICLLQVHITIEGRVGGSVIFYIELDTLGFIFGNLSHVHYSIFNYMICVSSVEVILTAQCK